MTCLNLETIDLVNLKGIISPQPESVLFCSRLVAPPFWLGLRNQLPDNRFYFVPSSVERNIIQRIEEVSNMKFETTPSFTFLQKELLKSRQMWKQFFTSASRCFHFLNLSTVVSSVSSDTRLPLIRSGKVKQKVRST